VQCPTCTDTTLAMTNRAGFEIFLGDLFDFG